MKTKLKLALFLILLSFSVYAFFQFPGFQGYEDETYNRIVTNIETSEFKTARSGYIQTILETPLVMKGQIIDQILGLRHSQLSQLYALLYNPFITAISVGVMFLLLNLYTDKKKAFLLSLVYAFGTMAFPYALIGMEPTAVLFVLLSVYFLFKFGKERKDLFLLLSGFFYSCLFFSKTYYFVTGLAFIIYLINLASKKMRRFIRYCLLFTAPFLLILPLYLLANKYNFGVYLGGQYNLANEITGGEKILFGVYGLLLSFGKSIFIYVPALILSVVFLPRFYRKYPKEALFILIYSLSLILFVSQIHWWSDETWGPRYLLSLSAIGLLPLIVIEREDFNSKAKNILITSAITLSFLFQLLGALVRYDVFPYTFYDIYRATGYNILASQEYQYIPQFAPYFVNHNYIKNRITGRNEPLHYKIIYTPPMEQVGEEKGTFTKEIVYDTSKYRNHALNFWWMNFIGISAGWFLGIFILIFIGLAWWGKKLLRKFSSVSD